MRRWISNGLMALVALAMTGFSGTSLAQSYFLYAKSLGAYPDLQFPAVAKELGVFSSTSNGIFKPQGEGPFPAVVLVHTCGGLQAHMTARAKDLLAAGYLVLVLDAYGPRNHTAFCTAGGVQAPRVYKDAFDALKHLSSMAVVDAARIYLVGLSLGSFAASSAASPNVAQAVGATQRFRASVGWYEAASLTSIPIPSGLWCIPIQTNHCFCSWPGKTVKPPSTAVSLFWTSSRHKANPCPGMSMRAPHTAGTRASPTGAMCTARTPPRTPCAERWNS